MDDVSDFVEPVVQTHTLRGEIIPPYIPPPVHVPMYDHPQWRNPRTGHISTLRRRGWVSHGTVSRSFPVYVRGSDNNRVPIRTDTAVQLPENLDDEIWIPAGFRDGRPPTPGTDIPMAPAPVSQRARLLGRRGDDEREEARFARDIADGFSVREALEQQRLRRIRQLRRRARRRTHNTWGDLNANLPRRRTFRR